MFTAEGYKIKRLKFFLVLIFGKKSAKKADIYKDNLIIYNAIEITNFKTFKINYFFLKKKLKLLLRL